MLDDTILVPGTGFETMSACCVLPVLQEVRTLFFHDHACHMWSISESDGTMGSGTAMGVCEL